MAYVTQLSSNAGEISPLAENRIDLEKYQYGCKVLENFQITPYGPSEFRAGTYYGSGTGDNANKTFLKKFVYSDTTSFLMGFSENTLRLWSNDVQVTAPAEAVTGSSWTASVATVVVASHTAVVGDTVVVAGMTPSGYDGTHIVTAVTATDVSYSLAADPGAFSSGGTLVFPFQEVTNYPAAIAFELSFHQVNDVVYIDHPDYPAAKVTRLADNDWVFAEVDWDFPPLLDLNVTDTTLTASAKTGSVTVTASDPIFESGHIGSYWGIKHKIEAASSIIDIGSGSVTMGTPLYTKGTWKVTTSSFWAGTLNLERGETSTGPWVSIRSWSSRSSRNIAVSGIEEEAVYLRLDYVQSVDPYSASLWITVPTVKNDTIARAVLDTEDVLIGGFVKMTGFTSTTIMTADVKEDLFQVTATEFWREGAFSDVKGHPRAVGFMDGSVVHAGTLNQPKTLWKSQIDDFENFDYGVNDDDALANTLTGSRNPIEWLLEDRGVLQIGTIGEVLSLSGAGTAQPWTPTSVKKGTASGVGSARMQGTTMDDAVVFIQRSTKKVRRLGYDFSKDRSVATDLTRFAEHITEDGIVDIAVSSEPDSILWCVTVGGSLIGLAYDEDENILGWFRFLTREGDVFESIETTPTTDGRDRLSCIVKRSVNGADVRYFEYFDFGDFDTASDAVRLDSAVVNEPAIVANVQQVHNLVFSDGPIPEGHEYRSTVTVTTTAAHGLVDGDLVFPTGTGLPFIDGVVCEVDVFTSTEFAVFPPGENATYNWVQFISTESDDLPYAEFFYTGIINFPSTTITGLDHLEGEEVTVLVDGFKVGPLVVSGGEATLPDDVFGLKRIAGLPYTGRFNTLNVEMQTQEGSSIGRKKNTNKVLVSFKETLGGKVGNSEDSVVEIDRREFDEGMDQGGQLINDVRSVSVQGHKRELNIWVIQDQPLPMTIQSITVRGDVPDK